jgi:NADH dehydrogenase
VPGRREIFVVGDVAAVMRDDGTFVPGVAPAANQEGRVAAENLIRVIRREPRRPFRYRDKGSLATIGRHRAVAQFGKLGVSGYLAWWLWLVIHILYLAGFRNRLVVAVEWGYAYITYHRGARLITPGRIGPPMEERALSGRGRADHGRSAAP